MARIHIVPTPGEKPFGIVIDQCPSPLDIGQDPPPGMSFCIATDLTIDEIILHGDEVPDKGEAPSPEEFVQSQRCGYSSHPAAGLHCTKAVNHEGAHGCLVGDDHGDEVEWDYPNSEVRRVPRDENGHRIVPEDRTSTVCNHRKKGSGLRPDMFCTLPSHHDSRHTQNLGNTCFEWDDEDLMWQFPVSDCTPPTCQVRSKTRNDKLIQCDKSAGHSDCHRSNHDTGYYLWRSDTSDYPVFHYTGAEKVN